MLTKKIFFLLLIILSTRTYAQSDVPKFLGKWQHTSQYESDGVHGQDHQVPNGEILIFESNSVVKDSVGNIGTYQLNKDMISINLNGNKREFKFHFSNDQQSITLDPTHRACDEGCYSTYTRRKK